MANVYLEGTYTEHFPRITEDEEGMLKLFRQFSTAGGIPSNVSTPTPDSIHEGAPVLATSTGRHSHLSSQD